MNLVVHVNVWAGEFSISAAKNKFEDKKKSAINFLATVIVLKHIG